eukprot:TRINITY_DN2841_c0_g1_i1.p1 TRINITY_DN2841_c0_g1~~TRINITY_DN2841_c0_g1_i1.p1  ORF type:complete len:209 (+),score=45.06 TRINITY_DN2841_c0_g1_i1:110-736(+)
MSLSRSVTKRVIYGNVAHHLGDKASPEKTHSWTLFVRPYDPQDNLSRYIERVIFCLHESFENPRRVVEKPPFEVTERGWGEFEIEIILCFRDEMRSSVSLVHLLRIFHVNEAGEALLIPDPLVAQFCDEIVFPRPLPQFRELLQPIPGAPRDFPLSVQPDIDRYGKLTTEEDGIRLYRAGIEKVEAMIKERMKELEELEGDATGLKKK